MRVCIRQRAITRHSAKMSKKHGKTAKNMNGSKRASSKITEDSIRAGKGTFNFENGDSYEGEYIVKNSAEIYRHGYGVYRTSDKDEYRAVWHEDRVASDLRIIFGNGARYEGDLDRNSAMSGEGTYFFPDGTSLKAKWLDNVPVDDHRYEDHLGHLWLADTTSRLNGKEIVLKPANFIRRIK